MDQLDTRQRRFVILATTGQMSPTAAAQEAGFTTIPRSTRIRAALTAIHVELERDLVIDKEFIQKGMLEAVNIARVNGEAMTMIAGFRELAKLESLYDIKPEVHINIEKLTLSDVRTLPPDKLRELMALAPRVIEGKSERIDQ
jgi:hypothetical protein